MGQLAAVPRGSGRRAVLFSVVADVGAAGEADDHTEEQCQQRRVSAQENARRRDQTAAAASTAAARIQRLSAEVLRLGAGGFVVAPRVQTDHRASQGGLRHSQELARLCGRAREFQQNRKSQLHAQIRQLQVNLVLILHGIDFLSRDNFLYP